LKWQRNSFGRERNARDDFKDNAAKQLDALHKQREMLEREVEKIERQIEHLEQEQEELEEEQQRQSELMEEQTADDELAVREESCVEEGKAPAALAQ
jgi:peptidoglycan hydrolase CwlO-like protein